ncbi:MAG: sugar transferase [Parcubacteria group bacterium]|nr:sugar transferase [Parcubacteria group bacterium]
MNISLKQYCVLIGDILILYGCLIATLFLRYGRINAYLWHAHAGPFAIIFALWVSIFYIAGLYDLKNLKNTLELINQVIISIFAGSLIAIVLFYLIPYFKISPKTNLAIFVVIFASAETLWRWMFNTWTKKPEKKVLVVGHDSEVDELITFITDNPQLGYEIRLRIKEITEETTRSLSRLIEEHDIGAIIITESIRDDDKFIREVYRNVLHGVEVLGLTAAYEAIMQKLPVAHTERLWILTNITRNQRVYEIIKLPISYGLAIVLLILFFPLMLLIGLIIKLSSRGPIFYTQTRTGRDERRFSIYKFRTMPVNAEKDGPQWSAPQDVRATPFGALLRATHLDELPQLINILKGDIAFVGPRPERPEFIKILRKQIPYYEVRHIVKPGITGWAQISYRYGSSIEDAHQKLQYDLFYIKNRSLILDMLIIVKTIKLLFTKVR